MKNRTPTMDLSGYSSVRNRFWNLIALTVFSVSGAIAQPGRVCLAFYNVENLFDTNRDTTIMDSEWGPAGRYAWDSIRYRHKLNQVTRVLEGLRAVTGEYPAFIGLSEVENIHVLRDLVHQPELRKAGYSILHADSPDRRGIDVAAIYRTDMFVPLNKSARRLLIYSEEGYRRYTRDILVVSGLLEGEPIQVLINHWPSRSGGVRRSSGHRIQAAQLASRIIDSLLLEDPEAKIVLMGDLNDNPDDPSLRLLVRDNTGFPRKNHIPAVQRQTHSYPSGELTAPGATLFNPFVSLFRKGWGTLAHGDQWQLYDQILVNRNLLLTPNGWQFQNAHIYAPNFMRIARGGSRGAPLRTFAYSGYVGGFSDHFPVYVILKNKS